MAGAVGWVIAEGSRIAGRGPRGEWLSIGGPVAVLRPQTVAKSRVASPRTGRTSPWTGFAPTRLCAGGRLDHRDGAGRALPRPIAPQAGRTAHRECDLHEAIPAQARLAQDAGAQRRPLRVSARRR
ncbi:hypothetical protein [Lysobacter gummosus]|uniref:hypothetical protein n=1 Tax=Lysobacter gummosus TaxID=262324 RepID=UPI00363E06E4